MVSGGFTLLIGIRSKYSPAKGKYQRQIRHQKSSFATLRHAIALPNYIGLAF